MKIKTPILSYDRDDDSFLDEDVTVALCRPDMKEIFGLKCSRDYIVHIRTSKPKNPKRWKKFIFHADTVEFEHGDRCYNIAHCTLVWLEEMFGGDYEKFDGHKLWVRVKEV